jgi:hypothetical protein
MKATCTVKKMGGNVVTLASKQLNFETETMKCDDEAVKLVNKFFPEVAQKASEEVPHCFLCVHTNE